MGVKAALAVQDFCLGGSHALARVNDFSHAAHPSGFNCNGANKVYLELQGGIYLSNGQRRVDCASHG